MVNLRGGKRTGEDQTNIAKSKGCWCTFVANKQDLPNHVVAPWRPSCFLSYIPLWCLGQQW